MYGHMLQTSIFLDQCEEMMFVQAEDVYYSLNSLYKYKKAGSNVRHINAMVLDFDYYKDDRFMDWEAEKFYKKKVKDKHPFDCCHGFRSRSLCYLCIPALFLSYGRFL